LQPTCDANARVLLVDNNDPERSAGQCSKTASTYPNRLGGGPLRQRGECGDRRGGAVTTVEEWQSWWGCHRGGI